MPEISQNWAVPGLDQDLEVFGRESTFSKVWAPDEANVNIGYNNLKGLKRFKFRISLRERVLTIKTANLHKTGHYSGFDFLTVTMRHF